MVTVMFNVKITGDAKKTWQMHLSKRQWIWSDIAQRCIAFILLWLFLLVHEDLIGSGLLIVSRSLWQSVKVLFFSCCEISDWKLNFKWTQCWYSVHDEFTAFLRNPFSQLIQMPNWLPFIARHTTVVFHDHSTNRTDGLKYDRQVWKGRI